MATEVAQPAVNLIEMGRDLETQELEAPGGVATASIYGQLLAVYLYDNDMQCKFLWKRIPAAVKNTNSELGHIWTVGQKMWQRDFTAIYESLKRDWSEAVKPIMVAVGEATRKRAFHLISQAYSSITAEAFAVYMGMSVSDAVQAAISEGWQADPQTRLVTPKRPVPPPDPKLMSEFSCKGNNV
ncbi:hypothetical protein ScPMuIL_017042 [Solemya velum]